MCVIGVTVVKLSYLLNIYLFACKIEAESNLFAVLQLIQNCRLGSIENGLDPGIVSRQHQSRAGWRRLCMSLPFVQRKNYFRPSVLWWQTIRVANGGTGAGLTNYGYNLSLMRDPQWSCHKLLQTFGAKPSQGSTYAQSHVLGENRNFSCIHPPTNPPQVHTE